MSYPNQRKIVIKKSPCDVRNKYAKINLDAMCNAMNTLSTMGALMLWLYLAKNQNNYTFDLSLEECKKYGFKETTYRKAFHMLEEKGFLIKQTGNAYEFRENGLSLCK